MACFAPAYFNMILKLHKDSTEKSLFLYSECVFMGLLTDGAEQNGLPP